MAKYPISELEATLDGGATTGASIVDNGNGTARVPVGNVGKAIGQVGVRVKAAPGRNASGWLFNQQPFTATVEPITHYMLTDGVDDYFEGPGHEGYTSHPGVCIDVDFELLKYDYQFTSRSVQINGTAAGGLAINVQPTKITFVAWGAATGAVVDIPYAFELGTRYRLQLATMADGKVHLFRDYVKVAQSAASGGVSNYFAKDPIRFGATITNTGTLAGYVPTKWYDFVVERAQLTQAQVEAMATGATYNRVMHIRNGKNLITNTPLTAIKEAQLVAI